MFSKFIPLATVLMLGITALALPFQETDAYGNPIGVEEPIDPDPHPEITTEEGVMLEWDATASVRRVSLSDIFDADAIGS
jgi:hypothetical protein